MQIILKFFFSSKHNEFHKKFLLRSQKRIGDISELESESTKILNYF